MVDLADTPECPLGEHCKEKDCPLLHPCYDDDLFADPDGPDELVRCKICFNVMRDPVRCPNEHAYGKMCLASYRKLHKECPECRMNLETKDISPARLIRNLVDRMKVICPCCLQSTTIEGYLDHLGICSGKPTTEEVQILRKESVSVKPKFECAEVLLVKRDEGFGLNLARRDGCHVFSKVAESGSAYNSGVCVGDELVKINDSPTANMRHKELVRFFLVAESVRVLIRFGTPVNTTFVAKSPNGYGFNLTRKGSIQIMSKLTKDGPAYGAGCRSGDIVIAVNGVPVAGKSHAAIVDNIQSNSEGMNLSYRRRNPDQSETTLDDSDEFDEDVFSNETTDETPISPISETCEGFDDLESEAEAEGWTCDRCTFINDINNRDNNSTRCSMCESIRANELDGQQHDDSQVSQAQSVNPSLQSNELSTVNAVSSNACTNQATNFNLTSAGLSSNQHENSASNKDVNSIELAHGVHANEPDVLDVDLLSARGNTVLDLDISIGSTSTNASQLSPSNHPNASSLRNDSHPTPHTTGKAQVEPEVLPRQRAFTISAYKSDTTVAKDNTSNTHTSRQQTNPTGVHHDQAFADWFHGIVSRRESEELLKLSEPGTFIVRFSESQRGYSVSHCIKRGSRIRHYKIIHENKRYQLATANENLTFGSLAKLVGYYRENPVAPGYPALTQPYEHSPDSDTDSDGLWV